MPRGKRVVERPFRPPTPREELDFDVQRAAEKAVLMHPDTVKLKKQIEKQIRAAVKSRPSSRPKKRG